MEILIRMNQHDGSYLVEIDSNNAKMIKDDMNECSTNQQNVLDVNNQLAIEQIPKIPIQKQRELDTFMQKSYQYLRMGNIYLKAAPDDTITYISRSCFYSNRKKVDYGHK